MSKPKVMSVVYSEDLPEESAKLLYRLVEKLIIKSLPTNPQLEGLFISDTMNEFKQIKGEHNAQL